MSFKAQSTFTSADPEWTLSDFLHRLEVDDLPVVQERPWLIRIGYSGINVALLLENSAFHLEVAAPDESSLRFIDDRIVGYLAAAGARALTPQVFTQRAGAPSPIEIAPSGFRMATVISVSSIMIGMMRLSLFVPGVASLGLGGLHVRLTLPTGGEKTSPGRWYTIRHLDVESGRIDIDIVRHDAGMIADWCARARPGDKIDLAGPGGGGAPVVSGGDDLLLAGDMTALPAIARMLDDIVPATGLRRHPTVWVSAPTQAEADAYFAPHPVTVLPPETFHASLMAELATSPVPDIAWFAGEFETAQAVRDLFRRRWQLRGPHQMSIAYWRRETSVH